MFVKFFSPNNQCRFQIQCSHSAGKLLSSSLLTLEYCGCRCHNITSLGGFIKFYSVLLYQKMVFECLKNILTIINHFKLSLSKILYSIHLKLLQSIVYEGKMHLFALPTIKISQNLFVNEPLSNEDGGIFLVRELINSVSRTLIAQSCYLLK